MHTTGSSLQTGTCPGSRRSPGRPESGRWWCQAVWGEGGPEACPHPSWPPSWSHSRGPPCTGRWGHSWWAAWSSRVSRARCSWTSSWWGHTSPWPAHTWVCRPGWRWTLCPCTWGRRGSRGRSGGARRSRTPPEGRTRSAWWQPPSGRRGPWSWACGSGCSRSPRTWGSRWARTWPVCLAPGRRSRSQSWSQKSPADTTERSPPSAGRRPRSSCPVRSWALVSEKQSWNKKLKVKTTGVGHGREIPAISPWRRQVRMSPLPLRQRRKAPSKKQPRAESGWLLDKSVLNF